MEAASELTPMMSQYRRIKNQLPAGTLLLFRLGDFYELFYEDALIGSKLLNIALTKRGPAPMCGIPYHSASSYISKLLKAGYRVAICDQVEEAKPGKLVKREVTQILSPGAHFDEQLLCSDKHNFLGSICKVSRFYGLALIELTTGEFFATELDEPAKLTEEIYRVEPAEIIFPEGNEQIKQIVSSHKSWAHEYDEWAFALDVAQTTLREHFKVASLDAFGLRFHPAAMAAAGAIVHYLKTELKVDLSHITTFRYYQIENYLQLDPKALRSLEVLEPINPENPSSMSLFGILNKCKTGMGARLLRQWLCRPLREAAQIRERQDVVEAFIKFPEILLSIGKLLEKIHDLERCLSKINTGYAGPRDLIQLKNALTQLPFIQQQLQILIDQVEQEELWGTVNVDNKSELNPKTTLLRSILKRILPQPTLVELLNKAIVDEPPPTLKEGGVIKEGFNTELDELRRAAREGKEWIAQLQEREIARTGIQSLKVRYNTVFGYYIEVTKANLNKVPSDYIRKQTITNAERFITSELKEIEAKILGAQERALRLEQELFQQIRQQLLGYFVPLQETARALAELDVLAAFAELARLYNYCRPEVRDEGVIEIKEGRHPVLEQVQRESKFIPNDTFLNNECQIAIITGPNMAGKSTYIRQVALLTIMAHIGSFVPARSARIDLVDRIFTRIGAADDIARGQSTFMVEMIEAAEILRHATSKSLIILDEVGRGTSTFDGLTLAWSIVEYLHDCIGAKVLFATHYHELTKLESKLKRVRNFNVAVKEWNDRVIFLHKIVEGPADKSYGIYVAKLAGVPEAVVQRARELLENLEQCELNLGEKQISLKVIQRRKRLLSDLYQLDLFSRMEEG